MSDLTYQYLCKRKLCFCEFLKDRVTVVMRLEKIFYVAAEFAIKDNSGYVLIFAEYES